MNALTVALILVALGSAGLVLRDSRIVLASGAVQWLGLAIAGIATPGGILTLTKAGTVEIVTALVSTILLATTLRSIPPTKRQTAPKSTPTYYLLAGLVLLLGASGGLVLAGLVPLSGVGQTDLAFYWAVLSGALVLGFEGASDPVKLAVGCLAVLNAAILLVLLLSITGPGPGLIALMSLSRIGAALLLGYLWSWLVASYGRLTLDPLFGRQRAVISMELAPLPPPGEGPELRPAVLVGPAIESDHVEAEGSDTE